MEIDKQLAEFQKQIDSAKLKLAEVSAKEKILDDQKVELVDELARLGATTDSLETIIKGLEQEVTNQLNNINQILSQLPPELLK